MKLLLIGEHYSPNLGDGVISLSVRHLLGNSCDIDLLDLSQNRDYKAHQGDSKTSNINLKGLLLRSNIIKYANEHRRAKSKLRNYLNEFVSDYDAAIYIGGSLFMDYFAVKQFYINKWLEKRDIPVLYNACGMGKLSNLLFEDMIRKAVNMDNVVYISMRDSEEKFERLTGKNVVSTYDNAVIISDYYKKKACKNKVFGIGFISRDNSFNECFFQRIRELVCQLNERKICWQFFSNGDHYDSAFMQDCFIRLKNENLTGIGSVAEIPHTPEELIETITGYERIVTCRLHSAIIAYSYLIPACTVSWDNKVDCFYSKIEHNELVLNKRMNVSWIMDKFLNFSYSDTDREKLGSIKNEIKMNISKIIDLCGKQ